jgi:glycosyltransferase involved in cell wall biosynthesis
VLALLAACRPSTPAWLAALVLVAALTGAGPLLGRAARAAAGSAAGHAEPPPAPGALRVLHLGFEDPAMPGAGGGSLRTAEVNRRLAAAGHRVTVLTTGFPGAVDRTEAHGAGSVRWVHVGLGRGAGRLSRLLGYVLLAPVVVRATAADLVVEDFFAPVSSVAAPWWSRRPTVGVVQWLNAREKAREYHLPVHAVERLGVRSHRRLVAVSEGVARRLAATGSRAEVTVIGNGVDLAALTAGGPGGRGDDVVFVGRLEIAQKGLDLLVDAWSRIAADVPGRLVLAGSGPDEAALRARVADRGLSGRVVFPGWVDGAAKTALLRGARLVVVPSRFETFGIVAVEALAAGSPVVAYDIDCLREVVPPGCGSLVPVTGAPAADAAALADAVLALYRDPARRRSAAAEGPRWAARWNWDAVAAAQEAVYREVARAGSRVPAPAGPRLLPAPPRRILEARP